MRAIRHYLSATSSNALKSQQNLTTFPVAIVKHFFEMCTAEALLIGHIAYVSLHVRGTMTKYKIHDVILSAFFYIAEGAFAGIVKGV